MTMVDNNLPWLWLTNSFMSDLTVNKVVLLVFVLCNNMFNNSCPRTKFFCWNVIIYYTVFSAKIVIVYSTVTKFLCNTLFIKTLLSYNVVLQLNTSEFASNLIEKIKKKNLSGSYLRENNRIDIPRYRKRYPGTIYAWNVFPERA